MLAGGRRCSLGCLFDRVFQVLNRAQRAQRDEVAAELRPLCPDRAVLLDKHHQHKLHIACYFRSVGQQEFRRSRSTEVDDVTHALIAVIETVGIDSPIVSSATMPPTLSVISSSGVGFQNVTMPGSPSACVFVIGKVPCMWVLVECLMGFMLGSPLRSDRWSRPGTDSAVGLSGGSDDAEARSGRSSPESGRPFPPACAGRGQATSLASRRAAPVLQPLAESRRGSGSQVRCTRGAGRRRTTRCPSGSRRCAASLETVRGWACPAG